MPSAGRVSGGEASSWGPWAPRIMKWDPADPGEAAAGASGRAGRVRTSASREEMDCQRREAGGSGGIAPRDCRAPRATRLPLPSWVCGVPLPDPSTQSISGEDNNQGTQWGTLLMNDPPLHQIARRSAGSQRGQRIPEAPPRQSTILGPPLGDWVAPGLVGAVWDLGRAGDDADRNT